MARARRANGAAGGGGGGNGDEDVTAAATTTTPLLAGAAADDDAAPPPPAPRTREQREREENEELERNFRPMPAVVAYCLAFLGFGAASNILGPTVDALAGRLPGSPPAARLSVVFFSGGLASTLGSVPSGRLIDLHPLIPGHRLLAVAMLTQALGLLAVHHLPWAAGSIWGLVACNCALSLTLNLTNTGVNTYSLWSARRAGGGGAVLVNAVHLFFGAGALCAPLLVIASSRLFGNPLAAFDLSAAMVALIALVFWVVPSPPRPGKIEAGGGGGGGHEEDEEEEEEEEEDAAALDAAADADASGAAAPALRRLLSSASSLLIGPVEDAAGRLWTGAQGRLVLALAVGFTLLCVGMEVAVGGWAATFAREAGGEDAQAARAMNSLYWLAFTLGRLVASAAAAVTTPTQGLACSLPLLAAGAAVGLVRGSSKRATIAVALALFGLGYAPQFANVIAALDAVAPVPGWVNGLLGGTASSGVMLVPPALGLAASSERLGLGWGVLPWAVLLATALQAALLAGQTAAVRGVLAGRAAARASKEAARAAAAGAGAGGAAV